MKLGLDTKLLKRRAMRVFFMVEIMFFIGLYLFGTRGIQYLMQLQYEQQKLDIELEEVRQEVASLNEQVEQWNATPFFKEKIAREQLQMAREGDEIYYIG